MDGMRLTRPTHSWIERVAAVMDAIALLHEARICVHSGFWEGGPCGPPTLPSYTFFSGRGGFLCFFFSGGWRLDYDWLGRSGAREMVI